MIRTPLCDLLGIEHPIVQGGMAWVGTAALTAAVSEAGAIGILGGGNAPPDWVRAQVREVKQRTSRPFGVNIPLFSPFVDDVVSICIEERVRVVATGAGNPAPIIPRLKEAGILVMPVIASVALAKRLERAGADLLVAEGMESGGHIGEVTTLPLVPQVVDAVRIPVVAAGGFADGRGLAAALALGAVGIQMGTRFICTDECEVHPNYKEKIVRAGDRATMTTGHSLGHPVRTLRNPLARDFEELERRGVTEQEIIEFGTGRLRLAAVEGDMVHGSVMAGQVAGLVDDIVPCKALVARIVRQAEDVLRGMPRFFG
ncbi:MAG TPA: enoyl-[acyl-carrier-protein] reductase FabK [Anaerolineae bacterium]|nr:enoyl-[acyl-carrier-protein] reductase FabK [Anaerolineae bacterium]HPL26693.1 enoyl-[acyl-carrier-protein] reductase FabK [Anaerolineae bacterium]